jgi:hypothetical protein
MAIEGSMQDLEPVGVLRARIRALEGALEEIRRYAQSRITLDPLKDPLKDHPSFDLGLREGYRAKGEEILAVLRRVGL